MTQQEAILKFKEDNNYYVKDFNGKNCNDWGDNECPGWNMNERRCDCGNRRVSIEIEKNDDGTFNVWAEAY